MTLRQAFPDLPSGRNLSRRWQSYANGVPKLVIDLEIGSLSSANGTYLFVEYLADEVTAIELRFGLSIATNCVLSMARSPQTELAWFVLPNCHCFCCSLLDIVGYDWKPKGSDFDVDTHNYHQNSKADSWFKIHHMCYFPTNIWDDKHSWQQCFSTGKLHTTNQTTQEVIVLTQVWAMALSPYWKTARSPRD